MISHSSIHQFFQFLLELSTSSVFWGILSGSIEYRRTKDKKRAHINSISATEIKINTLFQTFKKILIKEGCTLECIGHLCTQKFINEVIEGYKWPVYWIAVSLQKIANHTSKHGVLAGSIPSNNKPGKQV